MAAKVPAVIGLILFSLLFCYLAHEEIRFLPRASATRSVKTLEYVHERYQRSYFSTTDAHLLRRLHREEATVLLGIAACWAAVAYSKRKIGRSVMGANCDPSAIFGPNAGARCQAAHVRIDME
jgi:hypothetical protein